MPEINLSPNALTVLSRRYLKKDEHGNVVESPEEMFRRVANNIAQADLLYDGHADIRKTEEEFYRILSSLEFLPNSPTLMNAGRPLQQLAACFVLPVEDSLESIFDAVKNTALIHQSGGGTGLLLQQAAAQGRLRAQHQRGRQRSGLVHAGLQYGHGGDQAGRHPAGREHGHPARGPSGHPRVHLRKADNRELSNFNISVAVNEDFMHAVEAGRRSAPGEPA